MFEHITPLNKRVNVTEFERFIQQPENREHRYELVNGVIVEVSPTDLQGALTSSIAAHLILSISAKQHGHVSVQNCYTVPGDVYNARWSNVAFISSHAATPELVVRIEAPDDTDESLRDNALYFMEHGIPLVWVLLPDQQAVDVYIWHQDTLLNTTYTAEDTLSCGLLLPGFEVLVSELFTIS